ncbi:MAG TPA: hypothetical protein ENJ93_08715 [Chloroflexi bacterium]|nr:hypothetical protein [Chloroflexota bacterium]
MTIPLDIPIACELTETEAAQREPLLAQLLGQTEDTRELADGYALAFPNTDDAARQLLAFILLERRCCPFLQLEMVFPPGGAALWFNIRGSEEVKQYVKADLLSTPE